MAELEFDIKIENIEEFNKILQSFNPYMENELNNEFVRIASKEEGILKANASFEDVTGHLRRSLFVINTFHPPGIEGGTYTEYAKYVEYGHGTWLGGWFKNYVNNALPRIFSSIERAVNRIVNKFNKNNEGE